MQQKLKEKGLRDQQYKGTAALRINAAIHNLDLIHRCDKKNIFHSLFRSQRSSKIENARQAK